jgi:hypothetical protein
MQYLTDLIFLLIAVFSIYEPAVYYTITLLSAVFRVKSPSILNLTTMSDSQSLNTAFLEGMISSKNYSIFICHLGNLTMQIIFDAWWDSVNVDSKRPIAWNDSRHAPSWRFHLHCGLEENGSSGIICIVCHQVLSHLSQHGTSSMGKHLLAKAPIAKLNKLTESEVTELTSSTVDEIGLVILKRQASQGITIVSLLRQIIFDIMVVPYWPEWLTKRFKLAANVTAQAGTKILGYKKGGLLVVSEE